MLWGHVDIHAPCAAEQVLWPVGWTLTAIAASPPASAWPALQSPIIAQTAAGAAPVADPVPPGAAPVRHSQASPHVACATTHLLVPQSAQR